MAIPDDPAVQDYRKMTISSSITIRKDYFSFFLPTHKADTFFEGNLVLVRKISHMSDPHKHFVAYWNSRHKRFPLRRELWLMENGLSPPCSFFIKCLHLFFNNSVAGQSLWAGSATHLAEAGVAPHIIQATGQWATDSFQRYICKHPIILHALALCRRGEKFEY